MAQALERLAPGVELLLVRSGLVVGRLAAATTVDLLAPTETPPPADDMEEILDQFNAMIHDEF